jgi:hypothetical protein
MRRRRSTLIGPRRLVERRQVAPGSPEALVLSLLQSQRPYRMPVGRRQRVASALAFQNRIGRAPMVLRAAVLLGTLAVCGGAFAGARLLVWTNWTVERLARLVLPDRTSSKPVPHLEAPRTPLFAPTPTLEGPVLEPGVLGAGASRFPASVPAAAHRRLRGRVLGVGGPASREDDSPVLAALRALRREHDPVRARALLDVYLREHPEGTLSQEALALSIEAAVAHHDGDAPSLAARYLARYPAGPFSALARQALQRGNR